MLTTPGVRIFGTLVRAWPRTACQMRAASRKNAKHPRVIVSYHQENKLMFGDLLETSVQRKKRLKDNPNALFKEEPANAPDSIDQLKFALQDDSVSAPRTAIQNNESTTKKRQPKKTKAPVQVAVNQSADVDASKTSQAVTKFVDFPMVNTSSEEISVNQPFNLWKIPSVSKILNATMPPDARAALDRWKANLVAQLGMQGFLDHQQNLLRRGSQFHSIIHHHLSGRPAEPIPELEGCWSSLSKVLPELGRVINLESPVMHPTLQYRGIIDCIAEFRGEPMVIEWKKSDKRKPMIQYTYDAPLQMTAYIGAMNFDKSYPEKIKRGTVVVAYTDGTPADVFCLSHDECVPYWNIWLDRLNQFVAMQPQQ